MPLPPGFKTIEEIKNLPSDIIKAGLLVDVTGFIKDYQPPIETRGTDWKCTLEILDRSTQYENYGLKIVIFWPVKSMPAVTGAKEIVVLRKGKVQMHNGQIQLLANKVSEFHLLPSKSVPKSLSGATSVQWSSYRCDNGKFKLPDAIETSYILESNNHVDDMELPSDHEFEQKVKQAMIVKDKFSLLKDVKPENFYNILGQVIRVYESNGNLSLYLSDYTAHSKFYNYAWGEDMDAAGRDGDEYGYIKSKEKAANSWPGPFGKLTIQLTLYDAHAEFVRGNVNVDDWVLLSNVQIKFGKMGGMLEGFLRGDQHRFDGKIQVKIMEKSEDPDENDIRWKEAVGRKHLWWKNFKEQRQDILEDAAGEGSKRKNGDAGKNNSKKRRKKDRALTAKKLEESKANLAKKLGLNENIRCAFPDLPIVSFQDILKPQILLREDKTDEKLSPFTLCKYKATVRVVDYFPHRIEDFAVGHKPSEMDMLSDYSGGEDTDREEDLRIFRSGKGFSKKVWEWRFALQVEDASTKDSKERLWLMVDNHVAQGLLNLEADASNLRGNQQLLSDVKEQLFKLWGDLEEQKSATLSRQSAKNKKETPPSSFQSSASSPPRQAGGQPDLDSDNESSGILKERNINRPTTAIETATDAKANTNLTPRNKAFTCCIKQYGIKAEEDDPTKANAGKGLRWQRAFGLFDTYIV